MCEWHSLTEKRVEFKIKDFLIIIVKEEFHLSMLPGTYSLYFCSKILFNLLKDYSSHPRLRWHELP